MIQTLNFLHAAILIKNHKWSGIS